MRRLQSVRHYQSVTAAGQKAMRAVFLQKSKRIYTVGMDATERLKKIYLHAAQRQSRKLCRAIADKGATAAAGSARTKFRTLKKVKAWQKK